MQKPKIITEISVIDLMNNTKPHRNKLSIVSPMLSKLSSKSFFYRLKSPTSVRLKSRSSARRSLREASITIETTPINAHI